MRFGAYHIYLPALLKPAPRALATQLWALKHESPDAKGVGELLHLAASGRTSIPVDKETPKPLYRTAGYRVCGERAVRVDILERLADLIRPALSWREGAPGPKPDGVFDGRGFLVTGAMTSLTGASGEDFASILRSLGYRMDRKPKPAEPAPSAPADATGAAAANDAAPSQRKWHPLSLRRQTLRQRRPRQIEIPAAADLTSRSLLPEPELVVHDASAGAGTGCCRAGRGRDCAAAEARSRRCGGCNSNRDGRDRAFRRAGLHRGLASRRTFRAPPASATSSAARAAAASTCVWRSRQ